MGVGSRLMYKLQDSLEGSASSRDITKFITKFVGQSS